MRRDLNSSSKDKQEKLKVSNSTLRSLLRVQKKKTKEIKISRDNWKAKYMALKEASTIHTSSSGSVIQVKELTDHSKPTRYNYSTLLILLSLRLLSYSGCSLRACRHIIMQLYLVFELEHRPCPCHATIRMWACKFGYYQQKQLKKTGKWMIIADESMSLGENRVLLILGVRLDDFNYDCAIKSSDVEVLYFSTSSKWEGDKIAEVLKIIGNKIDISYVVSDRGNNLVKSYAQAMIEHIPDCTHALAKALEHYCERNKDASELLSQCGKLRQQWNMGKKTIYMPPSQRKKARFHNLQPVAKWAETTLKQMKYYPDEIRDKLTFLTDYQDAINEFHWITNFINSMNKKLKNEGFCIRQYKNLMLEIKLVKDKNSKMSEYAQKFILDIEKYFEELKGHLNKHQILYCSSDIIESTFGKMKYRSSPNSPFGMGEFACALVTLGKTYDREQVREAMEKTTEGNIADWKNENLAESIFHKRKRLAN